MKTLWMSIAKKRILFLFIILVKGQSLVNAQTPPSAGKLLFEENCVKCHGLDGTRGRWGAKNLQTSRISDIELLNTVSYGKSIMPNWSKRLSKTQIDAIVVYVKTLRN